jgi:hypothetical protein
MKRALGLFLMSSMAGCLGGGSGSDFGNGDGNTGDGDADSDGDVTRQYPSAPYWEEGSPPGGILADHEFQGNGSDGTVSFDELYQSYSTNTEVLVYALCVQ